MRTSPQIDRNSADGFHLNKDAYVRLIEGDLGWLLDQPHTPEREHIASIVKWSVDVLYPKTEQTNPPDPA